MGVVYLVFDRIEVKMNDDLARTIIVILILDLGYVKSPVYGVDAIRHQLAWDMAVGVLGITETKLLVAKLLEDLKSGRNAPARAAK